MNIDDSLRICEGKKTMTFNLMAALTAVVFLSPFLVEVTGNNYIKLLEDMAYLFMLMIAVQSILVQNRVIVSTSKIKYLLTFLILFFSVIGVYYNGISLVILQFREFKYLLLPVILLPFAAESGFSGVMSLLKGMAAINVPVSILQWLIYRDDGDKITGIFGFGASGTLTLFLLIMFFTELGKRLHADKPVMGLYFFYLIPTALNETKITFILIPVMLLVVLLLAGKLKTFKAAVLIIMVVLLFLGWAAVYEKTYSKDILEVFSSENLNDYLYATDWEGDAGRFAKVSYAYKIISKSNLLFGYGLGASYSGASSGLDGFIYHKFYTPEMFGGTRPQLFLSLIDCGLAGTLLIVAILIAAFIKVLKHKDHPLERLVAVNSFVVVFVTLAYQNIFYTYQIMYLLILYYLLTLKRCDGDGVIT